MTLNFIETNRPPTLEFVQQWIFGPSGSTTESETYIVDLRNIRMLELIIKPDLSDLSAIAGLREWRIYSDA